MNPDVNRPLPGIDGFTCTPHFPDSERAARRAERRDAAERTSKKTMTTIKKIMAKKGTISTALSQRRHGARKEWMDVFSDLTAIHEGVPLIV
mmetsp:Transcript_37903/g.74537  ORF Transcript_37903/g.74537 Transcript_37903/m.74537 type:complete len:92 (+) Transcript_37903:133-408(+)